MTERDPEQPGRSPSGWSSPGWSSPDWSSPVDPPRTDGPPAADPPPQAAASSGWGGPGGYAPPPGWGGPAPGAPRPGVVPLRPLGLGELLDGAVAVVRRYPRPTLGLSFAVALVTGAIGLGLALLLPEELFSDTATSADLQDAQLGGLAAGGVAALVVTFLAGLVLSGIITAVVGKAVLGQPMSAGEAWAAVRPRLLPLVGVALLTGLAVGAVALVGVVLAAVCVAVAGLPGLVLGIPLGLLGLVGAVVVYLRFSLAAPALVLERVGVRESLRRSGVLVRGSYGRVLGVLLLTAIIANVVGQVLQVPFLVLGGGSGLLSGESDLGFGALLLSQIGGVVSQTLTAPFSSGVRALLYIDRRMRAEGLDVSLAAAAAARR